MQVVTIAAIKGGSGKTATAGALAQAAAEAGKRVLAIDLDPQCSLSYWLNADLSHPGSYEVIAKGLPAADAMQDTEQGITVISGSANLTAIRTTPGSAKRLEHALQPIAAQFDFAVIDTGPAMGELQNNALHASDGVLIPLESGIFSLQGFYQTMDIANRVKQSKQNLQVYGVIVTQYDRRAKINRFMLDAIKEKAAENGTRFLTSISSGVAIREAMAMQTSIYKYAPRSKPAIEYKKLYNTIMEG